MASRLPKPVAGTRCDDWICGDELGKRSRQTSAPNLTTRSGSLVSRARASVSTKQPSGSFAGASWESASSSSSKPATSVNKAASDRAKSASIITRKSQHAAAVSRKFSLGAAVISKDVTAGAGVLVPSDRVSVTTSLNKTVGDTAGMLASHRDRRGSTHLDACALAQGSRPLNLGHAPDFTAPDPSKLPAKSLALDSMKASRPRRSTLREMSSSGTLSVVANSPGRVKPGPSAPEYRPGTVRGFEPGANVVSQTEASSKPRSMSGRMTMLPASKTSVTMGSRQIRSTVRRPSRRSSCVETRATSACLQPRCMPTSYRHHNSDISRYLKEGFPTPVARKGFSGCADQVFANVEGNNCAFETQSMFGIKKSRHSIHACYKIGRIIGDGNFAVVRECQNRKTQKSFALKIISKSKVKGKEHMIENEILILRRIRHTNIVELIEEFETPKEIFLVMELVEGGDLFDAIVANTRFPEHDSAHMIRDLALAVDYLHSLSIVHRDIKPENLLVVNKPDGSKALKLADFGLSMEVKSMMFLVCGTPTYVAPEILEECGYGLKVDIWAIGVICYILLCGFPPFRSSNHDQEELFDKILRGDYEYLAPFWDDICDDPRDLIDHLLVVDVNMRYDAKEILKHFWIEKWTRPSAKIHRELSEEANLHSRKRLRGVALAIQSELQRDQPYISKSSLSPTTEIQGDPWDTAMCRCCGEDRTSFSCACVFDVREPRSPTQELPRCDQPSSTPIVPIDLPNRSASGKVHDTNGGLPVRPTRSRLPRPVSFPIMNEYGR